MLLLSKDIIDCMRFHDVEKDTVYELSTIRTWLNKSFYRTAFNTTEKKMIIKQTLENKEGLKTLSKDKLGGKTAKDKVFFLSKDDIQNTDYGFNDGSVYYNETLRAAGI